MVKIDLNKLAISVNDVSHVKLDCQYLPCILCTTSGSSKTYFLNIHFTKKSFFLEPKEY